MKWPGLVLALAACACGDAGPREGEAQAAPWFVESARQLGLDFVHVSAPERRFDFPEIMSGGVGLFDYDGDGDLDVYMIQGGDLRSTGPERPGNALYRNRGDGTFEDVTAAVGAGDRGYGMGCATGDFDADGDVDLYVTNVGPNVLYRNEGGQRFTDVTAQAGVGDPGWGTSAAFLDYDRDGRLDLFVTNYIRWTPELEMECMFSQQRRDYCNPNNYGAPARDTLYHSLGNGVFEDVTVAAGLHQAFGNGLGVACGDFDGDGDTDIYVANDMNANQLWLNAGDGTFKESALLAGVALSGSGVAQAGMGVQALDLENDGDLDLFLSHLRHQSNTLYQYSGGTFHDVTLRLGLSGPSLFATGFGLGFSDFDHDGDLDLFVANGQVAMEAPFENPDDPYAQRNQLFEQVRPLEFEEFFPRGGTRPELLATTRGAAFGDLDGDGDIDAVLNNLDGPAHVLINRVGSRGHWVILRVLDHSGSDAIGARVRLAAGGRVQWRNVDPAYSYCSSNDVRVHFGLGAAEQVDEVSVHWPDGSESEFPGVPVNQVSVLRRPR